MLVVFCNYKQKGGYFMGRRRTEINTKHVLYFENEDRESDEFFEALEILKNNIDTMCYKEEQLIKQINE